MKAFPLLLGTVVVLACVSCSSLPTPGPMAAPERRGEAKALLRRSAAAHGNPWEKYRRVQVSYDGTWSTIAVKVQPVITDAGFRKTSDEVYQPRIRQVRQLHRGPLGRKQVVRTGRRIEVAFNDTSSTDPEATGAAALVADAYTIFLFGSSWLAEHGRELALLPDQVAGGESCGLVAGRISPGLGNAPEDYFIAWIGRESGLLRRFQFSLNGMDSTRGADVDVTFSEHWNAPDGSVWPAHFVESIQRPFRAKAHDWRMTSLSLDGRKVK